MAVLLDELVVQRSLGQICKQPVATALTHKEPRLFDSTYALASQPCLIASPRRQYLEVIGNFGGMVPDSMIPEIAAQSSDANAEWLYFEENIVSSSELCVSAPSCPMFCAKARWTMAQEDVKKPHWTP
jgi:hypothetical protein